MTADLDSCDSFDVILGYCLYFEYSNVHVVLTIDFSIQDTSTCQSILVEGCRV